MPWNQGAKATEKSMEAAGCPGLCEASRERPFLRDPASLGELYRGCPEIGDKLKAKAKGVRDKRVCQRVGPSSQRPLSSSVCQPALRSFRSSLRKGEQKEVKEWMCGRPASQFQDGPLVPLALTPCNFVEMQGQCPNS